MFRSLCLLCAASLPTIDVKWEQVAGDPANPKHARAVVVIPGILPHPFSSSKASQATLRDWQKPASTLVKALADDADVFAFSYGQTVAIDQVVDAAKLKTRIERLKTSGYREIVVVGYSAGGLIARQLVEDHPDIGVTKVVQICSPNGGSTWGEASPLVRGPQEVFLKSLSKRNRREFLAKREDKKIPDGVEFVCMVGHRELDADLQVAVRVGTGRSLKAAANAHAEGDGIVSTGGQWTPDLQKQGIPAIWLPISHFNVIESKTGTEAIAKLVRDKHPRWSQEQVTEFKERMRNEKADE